MASLRFKTLKLICLNRNRKKHALVTSLSVLERLCAIADKSAEMRSVVRIFGMAGCVADNFI